MLMRQVVAPLGFGVVGIVAAGLIGAILSSIDSMLNSGATIITFDVYRRYLRPDASERELILLGRICIAVFVIGAAALTIFIMDPNREEHFFTYVAGHTSRLVTGVVVAFALGMFWKRATPAGGLAAMIGGVAFSYGCTWFYDANLGTNPEIAKMFGQQLNFFHSAFLSAGLAAATHVIVSLCTQPDPQKSRLTWTELGGHDPQAIKRCVRWIAVSVALYAALGISMVFGSINPTVAGLIAAVWTFFLFFRSAQNAIEKSTTEQQQLNAILREDRTWAGLLAATAIFMMFYYY